MIHLSDADKAEILSVYLVANTPGYLLRHMKKSPIVEQLAREFSVEELAQTIRDVDAADDRPADEVATAYAAMVALTFKPYDAVDAAMTGFHPAHLTWITPIYEMWRQRRIAFSLSVHKVPRLAPSAPPTPASEERSSLFPRRARS